MTNHRSGAVTFKGNPLTLVGDELSPGAKAPDFDLCCYDFFQIHIYPVTGVAIMTAHPSFAAPILWGNQTLKEFGIFEIWW